MSIPSEKFILEFEQCVETFEGLYRDLSPAAAASEETLSKIQGQLQKLNSLVETVSKISTEPQNYRKWVWRQIKHPLKWVWGHKIPTVILVEFAAYVAFEIYRIAKNPCEQTDPLNYVGLVLSLPWLGGTDLYSLFMEAQKEVHTENAGLQKFNLLRKNISKERIERLRNFFSSYETYRVQKTRETMKVCIEHIDKCSFTEKRDSWISHAISMLDAGDPLHKTVEDLAKKATAPSDAIIIDMTSPDHSFQGEKEGPPRFPEPESPNSPPERSFRELWDSLENGIGTRLNSLEIPGKTTIRYNGSCIPSE